ncbi:hypothetical protein N7E81_18265 [Reichenbachiella carrageenanivorans]|uniref:Uncharacterized protein n=1 Tax=Reichenbachiella carrageenanivorans TaxID=2979869 RepID=A0ABY6CZF4_9BACT|nr:hypothetical protein [Reichenbachiella carrageenanivorans]UXX79301.1 hypothetical protein N7E81_18265 [Reichenbachiella carrageenanivorans]
MHIGHILEVCATMVLTAYFPILTYSFFKFRLVKKKEELMLLIERLHLMGNINRDNLQQRITKEFEPGDYFLPLSFLTMLTFIGMYLLFLAWSIYPDSNYTSVLFSGAEFWKGQPLETERRTVAVIAFAIMGGYVSASQYTYRRFSTVDLTPGSFFSVSLRIVFATLISLMIMFTFSEVKFLDSNLILVIAFLTGIFPDTGFRVLMERVSIFSSKMDDQHINYPLGKIEGISEMHKIRLNEIGIDNVQNLAHYNFFMLIIKTPFAVRTLLDWVSQAKLLVEFQGQFDALQQVGIRSVLDYLDALKDKQERYEMIASITGIQLLALKVNYENIQNDQSVVLLNHFRNYLENFNLKQEASSTQY